MEFNVLVKDENGVKYQYYMGKDKMESESFFIPFVALLVGVFFKKSKTLTVGSFSFFSYQPDGLVVRTLAGTKES